MTRTIELPEDLARRLDALALARGEDSNHYAIVRLAEALAAQGNPDAARGHTGAWVLAALQAEGVLAGYGTPDIDSPELARQLSQHLMSREPSP